MINKPKEASVETQDELQDIIENKKEKVVLTNGKTIKVGFAYPDNEDKIDRIFTSYNVKKNKKRDSEDMKEIEVMNRDTRRYFAKMAAAMLINGYFKLKLNYWWKWRWIYHFSGWTAMDYLTIMGTYKKKRMEHIYLLLMALSVEIAETWTTMTMKEAEEYRQELQSAREQHS